MPPCAQCGQPTWPGITACLFEVARQPITLALCKPCDALLSAEGEGLPAMLEAMVLGVSWN